MRDCASRYVRYARSKLALARILTIASEKCIRDSVRARVLCLGCTRYTSGPTQVPARKTLIHPGISALLWLGVLGKPTPPSAPRERTKDTGVTGTHKGALHPALTPAKIQVETLRNGPSVKCPSACMQPDARCANNPISCRRAWVALLRYLAAQCRRNRDACASSRTHARAERTEYMCGCTYPTLMLDPASLCPALPLSLQRSTRVHSSRVDGLRPRLD